MRGSSRSAIASEKESSDSGETFALSGIEHPAHATIGATIKLTGRIFSSEDLYIDGEVEGTIEALANKIILRHNGKVQADLKAREVVIFGELRGNVEAVERLEIRKNARLVGNIRTRRLVIEDGAYFKGSIDIERPSGG